MFSGHVKKALKWTPIHTFDIEDLKGQYSIEVGNFPFRINE